MPSGSRSARGAARGGDEQAAGADGGEQRRQRDGATREVTASPPLPARATRRRRAIGPPERVPGQAGPDAGAGSAHGLTAGGDAAPVGPSAHAVPRRPFRVAARTAPPGAGPGSRRTRPARRAWPASGRAVRPRPGAAGCTCGVRAARSGVRRWRRRSSAPSAAMASVRSASRCGPAERLGEQGDPAVGGRRPQRTPTGCPPGGRHPRHGGALLAVDGDGAAAHGEAGDRVRRHGRAAAGEPDGRAGQVRRRARRDGGGGPSRAPDGRVRGAAVRRRGAAARPRSPGPRPAGSAPRRVRGQPPVDGDPGGGRTGVVEPLAARARRRRPGAMQQLDGVAVAQHGAQRREPAVDAGADAGVRRPRRTARRRRPHSSRPPGRPRVPPSARKTVISRSWARSSRSDGPEGVGVGGGTPASRAAGRASRAGSGRPARRRRRGPAGRPVRGAYGLPSAITPASATLCIWCVRMRTSATAPSGAGHGRVQRLVQVELGGGDEVLELGDHRGEAGVQLAEDARSSRRPRRRGPAAARSRRRAARRA